MCVCRLLLRHVPLLATSPDRICLGLAGWVAACNCKLLGTADVSLFDPGALRCACAGTMRWVEVHLFRHRGFGYIFRAQLGHQSFADMGNVQGLLHSRSVRRAEGAGESPVSTDPIARFLLVAVANHGPPLLLRPRSLSAACYCNPVTIIRYIDLAILSFGH